VSTSETPPPQVTHNGHTLALAEVVDGEAVYTNGTRNYVPLERAQAMAKRAADKALESIKAAPQVDAEALRKQVEAEITARYESRILDQSAQMALLRNGFYDDEEARSEVLGKYNAVKPGEDGKRPTLDAWLDAQKAAGARWLKALMPDAGAAPVAPTSPAAPAAPKPPPSNVNGGTTTRPPAPQGQSILEYYHTLSFDERRARKAEWEAAAKATGWAMPEKK